MAYTNTFEKLLPAAMLLSVLILALGCGASPQDKKNSLSSDSRLTPADTHGMETEYAQGFTIVDRDTYKVLEIVNPYQDRVDTLRYLLKPRGVDLDADLGGMPVIEVPVRSFILTSTTHIALADMLNAFDRISGIVGAEYVYAPSLRERIESGDIVSFPRGEFNKEKALEMNPDLIMVSAGQSSQLDDYRVLRESGIEVLVNSEWLETTPLGKAEWVKVMAALLNKESLARDKFNTIAREYNELKARVEGMDKKPLVINNLPYKGAWFVSGGDSFTAQYLKDAGADYPWFNDTSTGGLRKDFEAVYEVGLRADIWINPGSAESINELLAKDPRFGEFKSLQNNKIYNNNKRMSRTGGNDFWESGVVHPERVLADLIHIFHPSVLPRRELYYYRKLNGNE